MSTAKQPSTGIEKPLDLAKQYDKAGNKTRAARFYFLAGEHAFAIYQNEDAITHLSAALALTPDAQVETRYKIMSALEKVYAITSQPEVRSQNLENMAALADNLDHDQKRADVAARLALFKLDNGDHQDAISISRLAVRIANLANAHAAEADLYIVWGRTLLRLADYDAAQGKLQKAGQIAQEHELPTAEAASLRYLGVISEEQGNYAEAKSLYKQALGRYELLNDLRGSSNMLNNLGKVAYDQGEYSAALRYWDHAKPNYLAIGDKSGTCRLLINQSAICLDLGDYSRGKTYSEEALTLSREIELKFGDALGLINLSLIHQFQGDQEKAQAHANAALELAQQMGSKRLEGYAYQTLGKTLMVAGKLDDATEQFWQATAIWHEMDQTVLKLEAETSLAEAALLAGDVTEAMGFAETAVSHLLNSQSLDGAASPFQIYLTCYNVLNAAQDARATELLTQAHQAMQERAAAIVDEEARNMFLNNVAAHRQLSEAFENQ